MSGVVDGNVLTYSQTLNKWTNIDICLPLGEMWALGDGILTYSIYLENPEEWYQIGNTNLEPTPTFNTVFNNDRFEFPNFEITGSTGGIGPSRIVYIGSEQNYFHTALSLSALVDTPASLNVSIFINGSLAIGSQSTWSFSTNDVANSFSFHKAFIYYENDIIDIRMSATSPVTITFNNINFVNFVNFACCH